MQVSDYAAGVLIGRHVNHQGIDTTYEIDKGRIGPGLVTAEADAYFPQLYPVANGRHITMGHTHASHGEAVLLPDLALLRRIHFNDSDIQPPLEHFIDSPFAEHQIGEARDGRKYLVAGGAREIERATTGPQNGGQLNGMIGMQVTQGDQINLLHGGTRLVKMILATASRINQQLALAIHPQDIGRRGAAHGVARTTRAQHLQLDATGIAGGVSHGRRQCE